MDKKINRVVNECISRFLQESASRVLYHYCTIESLKMMLETDTLYLSDNEQEYNGKGMNFMSLTRNRNSKQGYPYMQSKYSCGGGTAHNNGSEYMLCRIEFDGDAMNTYNNFKRGGKQHNFKVKPFDWLYHETGEMWDEGGYDIMNGRQDANYQDNYEEKYHQPFSQAEDRLLSTAGEIPHMSKYVRRIDIVFDINDILELRAMGSNGYQIELYDELITVSKLMEEYPIAVYSNRNDFDKQRNNVSKEYISDLIGLLKMGNSYLPRLMRYKK